MSDLTPCIAGGQSVPYNPFAGSEIHRVVPTTEAQREIWLADQLSLDASLAYNQSLSLALEGPLDTAAVRHAVQDLCDRHDSLRCTAGPDGCELLIAKRVDLVVADLDLSGLDAQAAQEVLEAERRRTVELPFRLSEGPLVRAVLVKLAETRHELILTVHHIVCDGWSLGVLVKDLLQLYRARHLGAAPDLPPASSFGDYAISRTQPEALRQQADDEQYWICLYDDSVPTLHLPCDRPRPPVRTFASRREDLVIDADLAQTVRRFGARHGASLFATMLGAFAGLIARLSGSEDVVVGVPAAGQSVEGGEHLVGHCVSLLPIRLGVDVEGDAATLIGRASAAVLDAYEHQSCTFGTLLKKLHVSRDPSRMPLVSVLFNLDSSTPNSVLSDAALRVALRGNPRQFENFELFLNVSQVDRTLVLECQYNTELFNQATVRRWLGLYSAALRRMAAVPGLAIASAFAPSDEDAGLLARFNATEADYDRAARIESLIARQVLATPDAIAVTSRAEHVTYRDLDRRASSLALDLRRRGVNRGDLVGLSCGRGAHMLVGLYGILKAGAAYVPMDPAYPAERLAYMAEDAALALLITDAASEAAVAWSPDRTVVLDRDAAALASHPATSVLPDPLRDATPDDPAYVIYTSGSTGKPKGVVVPHRAVVNFLSSMARQPGVTAADRLVAVTTLSFDIAALELLLPLTVGAEIVLASREQASDGQLLRALLESSQATVLQATPATWRMVIEAGWAGSPTLKALVGGETLPADLALQLLARCGQAWNMYGPTETTIWSTCWKVEAPERGIFIGRPIANTQVHILDERRQVCPIGVPGEICIGGDGVTLGYHNRPDLTAERFLPDPFGSVPGAGLYRTGDRGRWRAVGLLEHLGRMDSQVKVRGHRIELGEIESNLATHAHVAQTVVIVREDQPGDVRLVAYVVASDGIPTAGELREHLRTTLPEYMLPQHYVQLEAIPRLPNGKIDRKGLPEPAATEAGPARSRRTAPRTETEVAIASIWSELLGVSDIEAADNFFDLGGHSLLAMRAVDQIHKRFGRQVHVRHLVFETLEQMASGLEDAPPTVPVAPEAADMDKASDGRSGWLDRLVSKLRPTGE